MYIGETGRTYGVREKEHMKDVKELEGINYTRAKKRERVVGYARPSTGRAATYI